MKIDNVLLHILKKLLKKKPKNKKQEAEKTERSTEDFVNGCIGWQCAIEYTELSF